MRRTVLPIALALLLALPGAAAAEDPKPRPVDALIAELGSQFGKNREKAARELGLHGPVAAKAVPTLVKSLKDGFVPTRLAAALSLSRIDPSEFSGIPLLMKGMSEGETASRVAAAEALCLYPADAPGVVDRLLSYVRNEHFGRQVIQRLRALGPAVLPRVMAILEKGDPSDVRTIWPIIEDYGLDVVPALAALLESPDEKTRMAAAEHLAKTLRPKYPPEISKGIEAVVEGGAKAQFEAALDGMAKAGAASVPPLLAILISTEGPGIRVHAIRALERIGAAARPAARHLRMMTVAFDAGVRAAAVEALWKIDPTAMEAPPKPIVPPPAWAAARSAKDVAKNPHSVEEVDWAVESALAWLVAHQEPDGLWGTGRSVHRCRSGPCRGGGLGYLNTGTSALAVLALLANGDTHASGRRAESIRKGLQALIEAQDPEGCIGTRTSYHFIFNHAVGLLALADAAMVTGEPDLRRAVTRATNFALQCQNPYMGWRYGVRPQDNDTAVTGWMALALRVAERAGAEVPLEPFDGAKAWLDKVTEPEYGRVGYTARGNGPALYEGERPPAADKTEGLTAMGVLARLACGADRDDEMVKKGQDLLLTALPVYDSQAGTVDFHYWHFGSLALHGQADEKKWREALRKALIDNQCMDKTKHNWGSWEPVDSWSWGGGRVYATAINALTLQTPWRYPKEWFRGK